MNIFARVLDVPNLASAKHKNNFPTEMKDFIGTIIELYKIPNDTTGYYKMAKGQLWSFHETWLDFNNDYKKAKVLDILNEAGFYEPMKKLIGTIVNVQPSTPGWYTLKESPYELRESWLDFNFEAVPQKQTDTEDKIVDPKSTGKNRINYTCTCGNVKEFRSRVLNLQESRFCPICRHNTLWTKTPDAEIQPKKKPESLREKIDHFQDSCHHVGDVLKKELNTLKNKKIPIYNPTSSYVVEKLTQGINKKFYSDLVVKVQKNNKEIPINAPTSSVLRERLTQGITQSEFAKSLTQGIISNPYSDIVITPMQKENKSVPCDMGEVLKKVEDADRTIFFPPPMGSGKVPIKFLDGPTNFQFPGPNEPADWSASKRNITIFNPLDHIHFIGKTLDKFSCPICNQMETKKAKVLDVLNLDLPHKIQFNKKEMFIFIGMIIEVVPAPNNVNPNWYKLKNHRWHFHKSWLNFDFDKKSALIPLSKNARVCISCKTVIPNGEVDKTGKCRDCSLGKVT